MIAPLVSSRPLPVPAPDARRPGVHRPDAHRPGGRRDARRTESPARVAQLSDADRQRVAELAARDREVRAHEQAHLAAAGSYARGVHYETTTGPDGRRYTSAGSVSIDATPVPGDPRATIRKAQIVRRAALAPADPSAEDRRIAAEASKMAIEAQRALIEERRDAREAPDDGNPASAGAMARGVGGSHVDGPRVDGSRVDGSGMDVARARATRAYAGVTAAATRQAHRSPARVDRVDVTT